MYRNAADCWKAIPDLLKKGLASAPRNLVTLECCANAPAYAKPDTLKYFIVWEANKSTSADGKSISIEIDFVDDLREEHRWLYQFFIQDEFVRFPFNYYDSGISSICWNNIAPGLSRFTTINDCLYLPRFSTASRSSFSLIPEDSAVLTHPAQEPGNNRYLLLADDSIRLNLPEWNDFDAALDDATSANSVPRANNILTNPGQAAAASGIHYKGKSYRLYSVKTGVDYVGSKNERTHGKHRLEANSMLAMLRSKVIRETPHGDATFDIQTELLTVLAPLEDGARDGFQVRDLSCLRPDLWYLPAQAIPYINSQFPETRETAPAAQAQYWRENLAIAVGRAKALLFLRYGLIHTSANAQNFVLGFDQANSLRHFVLRDIGDTSWHDVHLTQYLNHTATGKSAFTAFTQEHTRNQNSQTLNAVPSLNYQSPGIVRLAANSLLTHGFVDTLAQARASGGSAWQVTQLYAFASGVLEGFRQYIQAALALPADVYPADTIALTAEQVNEAGTTGAYPYPKANWGQYKRLIAELLNQDSHALFAQAAYIHNLEKPADTLTGNGISSYLNAEELYLCAAVEKLLRELAAAATDAAAGATHKTLLERLSGVTAWPAIVRHQA